MTTKEKVHALLSDADRGYISGEDLAGLCGISRTAVWKAIATLRAEGCVIEAVTNRGYRISAEPDILSSESVLACFADTDPQPGAVSIFNLLDSTNTEAKRQAAGAGAFRGPDGNLSASGKLLHRSLIVADCQTAGRGRMGRVFLSPSGTGVYLSLLYSPVREVADPALITAAAAVAVCHAIEKCYGISCQIKWVNDIFYNNKKICGILTEGLINLDSSRIEAVIVGIGVNICDGAFPPELSGIIGSILGTERSPVSRNKFIGTIFSELLNFYDAADAGKSAVTEKMIAEYRFRSLLIGKTVSVYPAAGVAGVPYTAQVIDITSTATLLVELSDKTRKELHSGEVTLHAGG
jgi:BirA family transcriptional regulator, biotin operon repressor / biotin---[acetyl-CoA-carboxylase] ligase